MEQITGDEKAFPVPYTVSGIGTEDYFESGGDKGLTKREIFAKAAMEGLLAASGEDTTTSIYILEKIGLPKDTKYEYPEHYMMYIGICSVVASDSLIAALNKIT